MAQSGWPNPRAKRNGRGLILPVLLIVVGCVLFFNNLGVLPWSIWSTLAQLWPVILILIGAEFILGRRTSVLGSIVALVMIAVAIGWAAHHAPAQPSSVVASANQATVQPVAESLAGSASPADAVSHFDVPLGETQSAQVTVNVSAGRLSIGALPAGDPSLATADATLPAGMRLVKTTSTHGGLAEVNLTTQQPSGFSWSPFAHHDDQADNLAVSLSRKVPLSLKTNLGVGQSNLDLRDLPLQSLDVNSGVGQMTIEFPSGSGRMRANINSGAAGQTTLVIPANVGAYLHTADGLVSVHLPPGRYTQVADGYQSNNYANSTDQIDVYLHLGVGQVDVQ